MADMSNVHLSNIAGVLTHDLIYNLDLVMPMHYQASYQTGEACPLVLRWAPGYHVLASSPLQKEGSSEIGTQINQLLAFGRGRAFHRR